MTGKLAALHFYQLALPAGSFDAAVAQLFTKAKGGYYHDGRFADLGKVVDHYNATFALKLSAEQRHDLVELLKSL